MASSIDAHSIDLLDEFHGHSPEHYLGNREQLLQWKMLSP